ncbi:MAG: hypothetical protein ACK5Y2_14065 [Bdellovibrionales bacterium]
MSEELTPLCNFLQGNLCLIVEPSQSFAFAIQSTLQQMGVPFEQLHISRKIQDAKKIIEQRKPKILITEYEIEGQFAIDLIELQSQHYDAQNRISFINTMNDSDSAVAEASEGDVDGYLLKPFSMSVFKDKLEKVLKQKIQPSPYLVKINKGKKLYLNHEFAESLQEFEEAKPLHQRPTLAFFHKGQAYQALGDFEKALAEYHEGLRFQPLHYRCLTGEFEALLAVKKYQQAYDLIEPLKKNYPITARRLAHFFVAAVFTEHFDDLLVFYKLFNRIDQRTPELIRISSEAMMTAARYAIKENDLDKALEFFEVGLLISGRSFEYLERSINELINVQAGFRAQKLLSNAHTSDIGKSRYRILEFKVGELIWSQEELIEKGNRLIADGFGPPEIYRAVVKAMAELNKEILAGTFISKLQDKHPELCAELYKLLEDHLPKPAKKLDSTS